MTLDDALQSLTKLLEEPIVNAKVVLSFKSLFTYERGAKGFHRWPALKYFLFEYEEHLRVKAREENDKVSIDEYFATTIEHVIPQQYNDFWSSEVLSFTQAVDPDKEDYAIKVLLNSLGNMTLLKHGKNSSLGNKSWKEKKTRFSTGSYNEIDISKHGSWDKLKISERGREMLKFLENKIQGLTFSENEINELLFLNEEFKNSFLDLK